MNRHNQPPTSLNANTTSRKSLDRIGRDPRVAEVRSEGADGYWVSLASGYRVTAGRYADCISLRGDNVRDLLHVWRTSEIERE